LFLAFLAKVGEKSFRGKKKRRGESFPKIPNALKQTGSALCESRLFSQSGFP